MAEGYQAPIIQVRPGIVAQPVVEGYVGVRVTMPGGQLAVAVFSVAELAMLADVVRDAIVGGDGCGQWRASQARWNGNQWCCPVCLRVLTFPF